MKFTKKHRKNLNTYLKDRFIPAGLGTEEEACSLAAINLSINGWFTDEIPDCMSDVLGRLVIILQDAMPNHMRNSEEYKSLLPDMAGTGRKHEKDRFNILLDWMWETVLPKLQPLADSRGCGGKWRAMCKERTPNAAYKAYKAASSARINWADEASFWAYSAADSGSLDDLSARSSLAARVAAYAANIYKPSSISGSGNLTSPQSGYDFWDEIDPITLLKRMTYLSSNEAAKVIKDA